MFVATTARRVRCLLDSVWQRQRADVVGVAALVLLVGVAARLLVGGGTMVGLDTTTFFYPMYRLLGERLRAGDVPGWNPTLFAGAPFAGDPESGWTYLPAMLLFTLLPVHAAAKAFVVGHLALAAFGTYALGRVLSLGVAGALVAAASYALSGFAYDRSACCPVHLQVAAWVPLMLLAAELAIRRALASRAAWCGVSGFCLSQILAGWLGQGAYYALLVLGCFVAYRTLVSPPSPSLAVRVRLQTLLTVGPAILAFGFGLAAAGILPRLEYHARSNLADGYAGDLAWAATLGGWSLRKTGDLLLGRTGWYAGGATVALALLALLLARGRLTTPYFAALSIGALLLAADRANPFQTLLGAVLPRFAELTRHWPERSLVAFYLGPAMLAGAAVSALPRWRERPALLTFGAVLPILGALLVATHGVPLDRRTVYAVAFACLGVAAYALLPIRGVQRLVPIALLLVVVADLAANGRYVLTSGRLGHFAKIDLAAYYAPTGASRFLESRSTAPPNRFFGYDPALSHRDWSGEPALYRLQFGEPYAAELVVNNRASLYGLHDVQGYNPIQNQRYVEYLTALNGHTQEYHGAYVFPSGLASPLLDLLNARYLVVPTAVPRNRSDLRMLDRTLPVIYRDDHVRVLENRGALPRAWLVHEARQVAAGEALDLLAAGTVDPRRTALLEAPPPALGQPAGATIDVARFDRYEPDELRLTTASDAASLLVLSETYDPSWRAYVDGDPVRLYVANHALRAVPVPAGEHTVVLRYESRPLRVGLAISLVACVALVAVWGWGGWAWRRGRRSAL